MTTDEMTTTEVKTIPTMFERLDERGFCMKPMCGTPKEELIKRVSINGFVSLTCPKCGCIHTENWYRYRVTDPDIMKRIIDWKV